MKETGLAYSSFLMEHPEPVIAIDSRGLIIGCNNATTTKFDYSREELRGQNVRILIPEPDRSQHDEYINRYMETEQKKIIDIGRRVHAQAKSGKLIPVFLTVCEQNTESGTIFIGLLRDLSELDLMNSRLGAILQSTPSDILYHMQIQDKIRWLADNPTPELIGEPTSNARGTLDILISKLKNFAARDVQPPPAA